jgi:hypothetical protein
MKSIHFFLKQFSLTPSRPTFQEGGEAPSEAQKAPEKKKENPASPEQMKAKKETQREKEWHRNFDEMAEKIREYSRRDEALRKEPRPKNVTDKKQQEEGIQLERNILADMKRVIKQDLNSKYSLGLDLPNWRAWVDPKDPSVIRISANALDSDVIEVAKSIDVRILGFNPNENGPGEVQKLTWDRDKEEMTYTVVTATGKKAEDKGKISKEAHRIVEYFYNRFY